jgi:hypothetical protein
MATAKTSNLPDVGASVIRPALAEARLMTDKRACDAVYLVTLKEELRNIERKIAAMEKALQLGACAATVAQGTSGDWAQGPDATWIRTKSGELDLRLRRIEQLSKQ